ncbi:hypothetical protein MHBO_003467, partial [Bonamia ostreae]
EELDFHTDLNSLLEPKLEMMCDLKQYIDTSTDFVAEQIPLIFNGTDWQPSLIKEGMIFLVDVLMKASIVIGNNTSLSNDFTRLKRENQIFVDKFGGKNLVAQINSLQGFFSSANYIMEHLRDKIQSKQTHVSAITKMAICALDLIDSNKFFHPEEQTALIRFAIVQNFCSD